MIALTVPMSVLVATLMAFGRMSADNEVIALKSAGITIYKLLQSPLIFAAIITVTMIWFNDQVLPKLNHRSRIMLNEVTRKKPTLSIEPGIFVEMDRGNIHLQVENIVRDYSDTTDNSESILGPRFTQKRDLLENITIFSTSSGKPMRTITAEKGFLELDNKTAKIVITLFNGEIHEKDNQTREKYTRSKFIKNTFYVPANEFILKQNTTSSYRTDREMSISLMKEKIAESAKREMKFHADLSKAADKLQSVKTKKNLRIVQFDSTHWQRASSRAISAIRSVQSNVKYLNSEISRKISRQNQLEVEVQKKYSIPFACIIFIIIGAPLGIMAKKGGLGIGFSMSVAFFLLYWISLILGESLADKGIISPFIAMWGSNLIVGTIGALLVFRSVKETSFINWERLNTWLKKIKKKESKA